MPVPRFGVMRALLLLVLPCLLPLAGCSGENPINQQAEAADKAKANAAIEAKAAHAGFRPSAPAPIETVSLDPVATRAPGSGLPPGDLQYRYLGRWAVSPELCTINVWQFRSRDLTAAGGQKCSFPTVAGVPNGYELQSECRAGGRKVAQTIKLNFDEARHSMHVDGASVGPADLIYCGG